MAGPEYGAEIEHTVVTVVDVIDRATGDPKRHAVAGAEAGVRLVKGIESSPRHQLRSVRETSLGALPLGSWLREALTQDLTPSE